MSERASTRALQPWLPMVLVSRGDEFWWRESVSRQCVVSCFQGRASYNRGAWISLICGKLQPGPRMRWWGVRLRSGLAGREHVFPVTAAGMLGGIEEDTEAVGW